MTNGGKHGKAMKPIFTLPTVLGNPSTYSKPELSEAGLNFLNRNVFPVAARVFQS